MREWTHGGLLLWMHYSKGGVEAWALLGTGGPERAGVEIIEIAPMPVTLTLAEPATVPEVIKPATGDFPYLGPIPRD